MKSQLSERQRIVVITVLLALSLGFSLWYLAQRNIYDDELGSFMMINLPVNRIWQGSNTADVHPPGMYLLSKACYNLTGSERWMSIGPLIVLYIGLAMFVYPLSKRFSKWPAALVAFGMISLLHPQVLMWSNSIRWYPYWTGIALAVLVLTLGPRGGEDGDAAKPPGVLRSVAAGVLLGAMTYVSYMTFPFVLALMVAYAARFRMNSTAWRNLGIMLGSGGLISIPQIGPLLHVHMANQASQRFPVLVSAMRLVHGVWVSEAMLPWKPTAVLFMLGVGLTTVSACVVWVFRQIGSTGFRKPAAGAPAWISYLAFGAVLTAMTAISGLGGKARSMLLVAPMLGLVVAQGMIVIRRRWFNWVAVGLTAAWIVFGMSNLIGRRGTAKAGINDRCDEVVELIRRVGAGRNVLVFTHDPALPYVLHAARDGEAWSVCSVYPDYVHKIPGGVMSAAIDATLIVVVESFVGSLADRQDELAHARHAAMAAISDPTTVGLSPDPDIAMKRKIPGVRSITQGMPDYRFVVTYGPPVDSVDFAAICELYDLGL